MILSAPWRLPPVSGSACGGRPARPTPATVLAAHRHVRAHSCQAEAPLAWPSAHRRGAASPDGCSRATGTAAAGMQGTLTSRGARLVPPGMGALLDSEGTAGLEYDAPLDFHS